MSDDKPMNYTMSRETDERTIAVGQHGSAARSACEHPRAAQRIAAGQPVMRCAPELADFMDPNGSLRREGLLIVDGALPDLKLWLEAL